MSGCAHPGLCEGREQHLCGTKEALFIVDEHAKVARHHNDFHRSMDTPHHLAALYEMPYGVVDQNTSLRVRTD